MVRLKHRYLLVQILYPSPSPDIAKSTTAADPVALYAPTPQRITPSSLVYLIRNQVALLFGDYGSGVLAAGLAVKYFSNATSTVIVRCPRAHYRLAWAALTFTTELPADRKGTAGQPCIFRVVRVSGTIKKVEEEAIRRAQRLISAARDGEDDSVALDAFLPTGSASHFVQGEEDEVVDSFEEGRGV